MTLIDLLNKIANGEEVPEIIYYSSLIFKWTGLNYYCEKVDEFLDKHICIEDLEQEVEIIEELEEPQEHKIPEKIEYTFNLGFIDINDKDLVIKEVNKTINDLYKKYNEIIDYLEEENE